MTSSFLLLQNEGFLMQGCFKTSLTALRVWRGEERASGYVAFFNYATGLERLLKVLMLLDHWHHNRKFFDNKKLMGYGHNLRKLYNDAMNFSQQYGVERKSLFEPDGIDNKLLEFLSGFANGSRYFNLDSLTGVEGKQDPLGRWDDLLRDVYEKDVPKDDRLPDVDELDVLVDHIEGNASVKSSAMGVSLQTQSEHNQDQGKMACALLQMRWRLVKLLVPLQSLLIAIREKIHAEDHQITDDASVPYMEEFLDFVCGDKNVILESEDWP